MILAKLTGWGLNEILDMSTRDLQKWVASAQKLESEINKQAKRK